MSSEEITDDNFERSNSQVDEGDENSEEKIPDVTLDEELLSKNLKLLARTANGVSFAFTRLEIHEENLCNIDILQKFKHLRYVDLSNNNIKNIEPLSNIKYLLSIDVHNNKIEAVPSSFSKRPYLQYANFSNNKIASFKVSEWAMLSSLNLNDNQIDKLQIDLFNELVHLEARNNKLDSTQGINTPKLKELYLAKNEITKLEGLSQLTELEKLHLRENKISNLDGFTDDMRLLSEINLRGNEIENFEELDKLKCLPNLKRVVLQENPIAGDSNYRNEVLMRLPTLKILDKDEITSDDLDSAEEYKQELEERKRQEELEREEAENGEGEGDENGGEGEENGEGDEGDGDGDGDGDGNEGEGDEEEEN